MDLRRDRLGPPVKATSDARRALAAGIGLAIVALTYGPSLLGSEANWWAAGVTIGLAIAMADVLLEARRLLPVPGVAPLTIVAALVAVWLCVPENDQVPIAAVLPFVVVGLEVVRRRQVTIEWYAVAGASVLWAGMFGATGRQSALVGALFAWWAVALLPLVHAVRPIRSTTVAVAVAALAAVTVVAMARIGGVATTASAAWAAAGLLAVASFGLAIAMVSALDKRPDKDVSATP